MINITIHKPEDTYVGPEKDCPGGLYYGQVRGFNDAVIIVDTDVLAGMREVKIISVLETSYYACAWVAGDDKMDVRRIKNLEVKVEL